MADEEAGVEKAPAGASIRDVGVKVGDNIIAKAKEIIKPIDEATGGKFANFDKAITEINKQLSALPDQETEEALRTAQKTRIEWQQDKMIDEMQASGVSPDAKETLQNW